MIGPADCSSVRRLLGGVGADPAGCRSNEEKQIAFDVEFEDQCSLWPGVGSLAVWVRAVTARGHNGAA